MFNGHLMNASVGVSYTFKNTKSLKVAEFIPITPEPIVQPITEPVLPTTANRNQL